jgi:hypothetical protein
MQAESLPPRQTTGFVVVSGPPRDRFNEVAYRP